MNKPLDTPKPKRKSNKSSGDIDTPPSAKSESSDTTTSSSGNTVSTTFSVGSGGASSLPWALLPPRATEEEEEDEDEEGEKEEIDQEGLPDKIKNRRYLGEDGKLLEVKLLEDIEEFGLEDRDIDLSSDGIAHWRMAPSRMHREAVGAIDYLVANSQGEENDSLCTDKGFSVLINRRGVERDPDLAVWGKDRKTAGSQGEPVPITKEVTGFGSWCVNPHVIFEFSWSHDLNEEIPKFLAQMNEHLEELGRINLGFLIKTKSSQGKKYPPKKEPGKFPMYGFDIYEARPSDRVVAANPTYQYRVGDEEEVNVVIPGHDLTDEDSDGNYLDITIPIQAIREALERTGVRFEKLEETN